METLDLMQLALERAKAGGASQADVLFRGSLSKDVETLKGEVSKSEINSGQGMGVRLIKDGKPGYAYTHRLESEQVKNMVGDALEQSVLSSAIEIDLPSDLSEEGSESLEKWNPELEKLGMEEMKDFCVEMEAKALTLDDRIVNLPHIGASSSSSSSRLMNSKGLYRESQSNQVQAYLGGVAKEGDFTKSGFYANGGRDRNILDVDFYAEMAVKRCTELLGAKPLPSGDIPVVFSNRVSPAVMGMYLGAASAESVLKGQSRFSDKLGHKVAVDDLEVICDPTIKGAPGSRLCDSEGILCRKTPLIEGGVLKTFIHNLETSKKMSCEPTGHGQRSIQGKAGMGFSNLMVKKGEKSLSELFHSVDRCLWVTKLEGSAACSQISGELSIGVQGFLVEGGEIVHPVDAVTLSGNFFDFIQDIQGFSSDYSDSFQSTKVPDLLIGKLALSG